jgi:hypothetical protein
VIDMIFEEGMVSRAMELWTGTPAVAEACCRFLCSAIISAPRESQIHAIAAIKHKDMSVISFLVSRALDCLTRVENRTTGSSVLQEIFRAFGVLFSTENDLYARKALESEKFIDIMYQSVDVELYDIMCEAGLHFFNC